MTSAPGSPQRPETFSRQALSGWAGELAGLYQSGASNQFILYGNVNDRHLLGPSDQMQLGTLSEFLQRILLPRFDVILSYDVGNGIRVEKGGEIFSQWPVVKEQGGTLPDEPRLAIETLTVFLRYAANLARLKRNSFQVALIMRGAQLVIPAAQGSPSYDLSAMAFQVRDWSTDTLLTEHALATFLITENLNDLHPLLVNNSRCAQIKIPLPTPGELDATLKLVAPSYPLALKDYASRTGELSNSFAGATCAAVESLLKTTEHRGQPLSDPDLVKLKKQLVEKDCSGLIEFIDSRRTLNDLHGQEPVKKWLRQDFALWRQNDLGALPMGYLLCGPVGTGKTFMVECLAGEAGVPVVKLKNFRDKWVGSTESNLEKIFRLLQALGRCFVFIDEADQALGRREGGSGDSGVGGRVYSMMAEEMSNTQNRGKIVWVLASSRPDLIEVDLKRPGRIDIKIPLFPTATPEEAFGLIVALCKRKGLGIDSGLLPELAGLMPNWLTPGAAETLAVKVYRSTKTLGLSPVEALKANLQGYRSPVAKEVMEFQIGLARNEASDMEFVPAAFR
jgi:hypothetical protein